MFGLPLLVGGVSLAGWFGRTMRRAGTPFRLSEPATTLGTDGPFRAGLALPASGSWSA